MEARIFITVENYIPTALCSWILSLDRNLIRKRKKRGIKASEIVKREKRRIGSYVRYSSYEHLYTWQRLHGFSLLNKSCSSVNKKSNIQFLGGTVNKRLIEARHLLLSISIGIHMMDSPIFSYFSNLRTSTIIDWPKHVHVLLISYAEVMCP